MNAGNSIDNLASRFAGKLVTAPEDMALYLTDWRGIWTGKAIAVARPDTAQDTAAILQWCAETNTPVVPQGGNTGLSGGATPDTTGHALVIAMDQLKRVRKFDPQTNIIEVEAGLTLQNVQQEAEAHNRLFPLSLAAEGTCQIGGVLATNAGGTHAFRYGLARDLCVGLEVALPNGKLWEGTSSLFKDNTGYALRQLFIGSEGTLGVITAANLKLFPRPSGAIAVLVGVDSIQAACNLYAQARDTLGPELTACEMISDHCAQAVTRHIEKARNPLETQCPHYVLLEISSWESEERARARALNFLEQAFENGAIEDAVLSESGAQFQAIWALRENISEAQSAGRPVVKHDISLPLSNLAAFDTECQNALSEHFPNVRVEPFGHLGDGNLHYNIVPTDGSDKASFLSLQEGLNKLVHDLVVHYDGSISAEHGIGVLRRAENARYKSEIEKDLVARLKKAIDPNGLMNPGKLL